MKLNLELLTLLTHRFWIAFLVSGILAYPIWKLLLKTKSRQTISEYAPEGHQLKQGTPTMGGLIIVVGYAATLLSGFALQPNPQLGDLNKIALAFLALIIGFAVIGFVDDFVVPRLLKGKRGLGWKQKIVMQFGLAIVGTGLCYGWSFDFSFAASVFLILFFSNAYNFSDGLDGLAGTLLLGLVLGVVGISLATGWTAPVALMVIPLAGAVIPFLFLNAPPAKVFMGDVGALPIGAVLGLGVSCLTFKPDWVTSVIAPDWATAREATGFYEVGHPIVNAACIVLSLMMVIELVPVPLQILSVKLLKRKLFPYTPIHHAFEKAGWPETRVVWMFALVQLLLSLAALGLLVISAPRGVL